MTTLIQGFGGQLMLVAVVAFGACLLAYRVRDRHLPYGLKPAAPVLALGSALAIAMVTLTPQGQARAPGVVRLHPLATIRGYKWHGGWHDLVIYVLGNIALFVPLGFFLYLTFRPVLGRFGSLITATALGGCVSLGVEILQLPIWSRSTDVDDWLTNTFGTGCGALLAALVFLMLARFGLDRFWTATPGTRAGSAREQGRRYSYQDAR